MFEGLERAFEARKLFRATSICSFYTHTLVNTCAKSSSLFLTSEEWRLTYGWDLAVLESVDDAIELELPVDIGLLDLLVGGLVNVGRHDERLSFEFAASSFGSRNWGGIENSVT